MVQHDWPELLVAMTDRDPAVRDGWAYQELAEGLGSGRWADDLPAICEVALTHFHHPEVQARTFAPLICCWIIQAGGGDRAIFDECAAWYLAEADTRGCDPELGWLHGVAHGADCLGVCATAGLASGDEVLAVLAQRAVMEAPVWGDREEARMAAAIILALIAYPTTDLGALFDPIEAALTGVEQSFAQGLRVPPRWLANAQALAHVLYVCAHEPVLLSGRRVDLPKSDELGRRSISLTRRMLDWLVA